MPVSIQLKKEEKGEKVADTALLATFPAAPNISEPNESCGVVGTSLMIEVSGVVDKGVSVVAVASSP